MTVEEAANLFKAVPSIRDKMETLKRVGLGYIKVGQQATTLSGGEAQRVKLVQGTVAPRRPAARSTFSTSRRRACISTTSRKLLEVLHELVEQGNTVVVIEHNLEVIKTRRLDHRPGAGGRRRRRRDRRRGHARADRASTKELHGTVFGRTACSPVAREGSGRRAAE